MILQKKKSFLFGRLGNKDNDIKYFINYLPSDCKKVVEPFGGSFAVIRRVYVDDKYAKFVNDTDVNLYEIYKNPDEYLKSVKHFNKVASEHKNEKGHVVYKKFLENWKEDNIHFKNYLLGNSIVRGTNVKCLKKIDHEENIKFIKKINFTQKNYLDVIKEHQYDKDAFIFLDPPYLFSDNSSYYSQNEETDMTRILVELLNIYQDKKTKCKLMLVINNLYLTKYLFKDYVKTTYDKIYQISKKKQNHLVICNY
jgi:site-specific DNA-adenine methylase